MTYRSICASLAPDAEAAEIRLLGEGLWGRVVDLADGTVMKLISQGKGLGRAIDLWQIETQTLAALAESSLPCAYPCLIASEKTGEHSEARREGYVAWIRMSRVAGTALDDDKVTALSAGQRDRFAHQLGEILATLHRLDLPCGFGDPQADVEKTYLDEIEEEIFDVAGDGLLVALRARLAEAATSISPVPNHGDINTTNIMANDQGRITGLIDWAEAQFAWPETDLCLMRFRPELMAPVRASYEACTGLRLDDQRLNIGALQSALLTVTIARRLGDEEEEAWGREWVARLRGCVMNSRD